MTNTLVHSRSNTSSSSELRFVSSTSQSTRSARMDAPTATRNVTTYVQTLNGQIMSGWALREPISLIVEQEGDGYLATESITTVYGYGETGPEAVTDYIVSLCEYYELLEASNAIETFPLLDRLGHYLIKTNH